MVASDRADVRSYPRQGGGAPGVDATGKINRVTYIVSMFPCWSETFICREIQELIRRGIGVQIISLRKCNESLIQTDAAHLLNRVIYPVGWRPIAKTYQKMLRHPWIAARQLGRILRRFWRSPEELGKNLVSWQRSVAAVSTITAFKPDRIHAHWATYASTAALHVHELTGIPFSFTAHAHDIYVSDHFLAEKLELAAFVVTISRFNRDLLRRKCGARVGSRIRVIHCALPVGSVQSQAEETRGNHVLSVGRLDPIKGFPTLIRACDLLRARGIEFHCDIVGDGPLRDDLRQMVRKLDLEDKVTFQGALPSTKIRELMSRASTFVLASQKSQEGNMDGIPVALMEAMAAGTPVVATAVSGIPELVIDRETGLIVPPRDPAALANAIEEMMLNFALREVCRANARQLLSREFRIETEADKLIHSMSCAEAA